MEKKHASRQNTAAQHKHHHQMHSTNLAQREVAEEGWSTVCLPEGEGRGVAGEFEASTTVLGCNLGLERPPVLWIRVQSLERGETTLKSFNNQKKY